MDLGAGRRGVDMGPSAIRLACLNEKLALLGYQVDDLGNVRVDLPENIPAGPVNARYLPQIAHTCERVAEMVERAMEEGRLPLVLGGDHSVAMGTVAGVASLYRKHEHSGIEPQRQRSRDAARVSHRNGASGADPHRGLRAESGRSQRRYYRT